MVRITRDAWEEGGMLSYSLRYSVQGGFSVPPEKFRQEKSTCTKSVRTKRKDGISAKQGAISKES